MPDPLIRPLPPGPLDVVADVHGESDALDALLTVLGYRPDGSHPASRRLVFVGDLIDRGPDSVGSVERVRRLAADHGALCVLGNHELNALRGRRKADNRWFFDLPDREQKRLAEFFASLPLALERADLRVAHACWDDAAVAAVRHETDVAACFHRHEAAVEAVIAARRAGEWGGREPHWQDVEADLLRQNRNPVKVLTSGPEERARLPFEANGELRHAARVPWWEDYAGPLCVVGHYWRAQGGKPTADHLFDDARPHDLLGRGRAMCIDYSVGWRYRERATPGFDGRFRLRLAALRVPEMTLAFDDGTGAPVGPAVSERPWGEWMDRAREYRAAAAAAPPGNPRTFLVLHAVELLLKAELLRRGTASRVLMKTHRFDRLMRAVGLDPAGFGRLVAADPKMTLFRYPTPADGDRPPADTTAAAGEADALWADIERRTG